MGEAYCTYDYEKIRPAVRKCPRFGTAFTDCAFQKPRLCIEQGYVDICILKKRCVFKSHLCAEKWKERMRKNKPLSVRGMICGDTVVVANPILHR